MWLIFETYFCYNLFMLLYCNPFASEILEKLEEMFPRYDRHNDVYNIFKALIAH